MVLVTVTVPMFATLLLAALAWAALALAGEACTRDARENDWAAPTTPIASAQRSSWTSCPNGSRHRGSVHGERHDAGASSQPAGGSLPAASADAANGSKLAIGMEFFQTPYQSALTPTYARGPGSPANG